MNINNFECINKFFCSMIVSIKYLLFSKKIYLSFDLTFCVSNEYRIILRYRLMIPKFSIDEVCLVRRKTYLNNFGEHVVRCNKVSGFKYRHDYVRDVLFDLFRRAGVPMKTEASVNFLTNPLDRISKLKHADNMVYRW